MASTFAGVVFHSVREIGGGPGFPGASSERHNRPALSGYAYTRHGNKGEPGEVFMEGHVATSGAILTVRRSLSAAQGGLIAYALDNGNVANNIFFRKYRVLSENFMNPIIGGQVATGTSGYVLRFVATCEHPFATA